MNHNLAEPFYRQALDDPNRLAISVDGESFTYGELLDRVARLVHWLTEGKDSGPERVGILASRSLEACAGILAAAWIGASYVPIGLKFPEARMIHIMERSRPGALIADKYGSKILSSALLRACPSKILGRKEFVPNLGSTDIVSLENLAPPAELPALADVAASSIAYILYTSGSTGEPKGVMIPTAGVEHLLEAMDSYYQISPDDRVAETTDTSFDISVFNMFATWRAGASLHVIPATQAMGPAKFIREHEITVWYSVPSIAVFMKRMGLLTPGCFPTLRCTYFCGEPLLTSTAEAWQLASPSSLVTNLYGPTEATVMCMGEEYRPGCAFTRDCVAIGRAFPGLESAIIDADLKCLPADTPGELVLSGPQLALGYFDNAKQTASSFVTINRKTWYRTGDLASCDQQGTFHYLGRIDNQVKVLGYRVELEEIECHLREVTGSDRVAAVPWPLHEGSATGIVAFVANFAGSTGAAKTSLQARLPTYMVPTQIHVIGELPMNNNGKVDRKALRELLTKGPAT